MEIMVNPADYAVENEQKQTAKAFLKDFAQGYFEVEKMKKEQELKQYKKAYNNLGNKDSFNGQYLESIIYNLEH